MSVGVAGQRLARRPERGLLDALKRRGRRVSNPATPLNSTRIPSSASMVSVSRRLIGIGGDLPDRLLALAHAIAMLQPRGKPGTKVASGQEKATSNWLLSDISALSRAREVADEMPVGQRTQVRAGPLRAWLLRAYCRCGRRAAPGRVSGEAVQSLHRRGRSSQSLTNPEDRRLGRKGDAGPGTPSAPPHEGKRVQAAREGQAAYASAATKRLPAFPRQNGAKGAVATAQRTPVKPEAVSLLRLDVVNDAAAISPHKERNAAVYRSVHPCADLADGFARWHA